MEPVKRKLMAILAADAVGYSRMMGEDEERTVRVLSDHREVIDALIANYGARIIGTAGDSVLAEFGSTVDAVRCATEIQEAIRGRNDKLPEHERMWFRIGVNLGDVIVSEADVHGDGVNVAVRLESIAEPGGVCISSSVYDQISGKLNLGFTDIGEQNLKNISRPIRAYRFAGPVPPVVPQPMKRSPQRRSAARWVWGAAATLAIVAVVAVWQADRLTQQTATATAAAARRAEEARRAEDEARLRTEERAKMETALARARAEAEAAKKAVAAAEAQRALEAQRASEAELARARTEAETIRRDARSQALAASRAREEAEQSAAKAKALEETAARAAEQARTQQQAAAMSVTARPSYDGDWVALQACPATRRAPEVRTRLPTTISQGVVQVRRGRPGENGYVSLDGKIAADGSVAIRGVLIPARVEFGREERPVHYEGKIEGEQFLLRGEIGQRPCTLALNRFGR